MFPGALVGSEHSSTYLSWLAAPCLESNAMLLFEADSKDVPDNDMDYQMVPDISLTSPVSSADILELEDKIAKSSGSVAKKRPPPMMLSAATSDLVSTNGLSWPSSPPPSAKLARIAALLSTNDASLMIPITPTSPWRTSTGLSEELLQFLNSDDVNSETEKSVMHNDHSVKPPAKEAREATLSDAAVVPAVVPMAPASTGPKRKPGRATKRLGSTVAAATAKKTAASPGTSTSVLAEGKAGKTPGTRGKRGLKKETTNKQLSGIPVVAFDETGLLPRDHRPARGRGRHLQLQSMSKEQIEAEEKARAEKNRLAARHCRQRRKNLLQSLESKIAMLEEKDKENQRIIAELKAKLEGTGRKVKTERKRKS